MIEMGAAIWFLVGLAAGFLHATMLWRHVHRLSVWTSLWGLCRLAVVASLLFVAALAGAILSAAAGWAVGLAALGTWFVKHGTDPAKLSSRRHAGPARN